MVKYRLGYLGITNYIFMTSRSFDELDLLRYEILKKKKYGNIMIKFVVLRYMGLYMEFG